MMFTDLSNADKNKRFYDGVAGLKVGITFEGQNYLLKFPDNLKLKGITTKGLLTYSNSPFSEYLGSGIYALLEVPVHEVSLALYKGKIVAACRDFVQPGQTLNSFERYCTTTDDVDNEIAYRVISGHSRDLELIKHNLRRLEEEEPQLHATERFWTMFAVDALIGNPDRHCGNWGLLEEQGRLSLAPVYDNGSSLFCKLSAEEINKLNSAQFKDKARNFVSVLSIDGKKINPLHYLYRGEDPDATDAFCKIYPVMEKNGDRMDSFLRHTPQMAKNHADFLADIIAYRLSEILRPCYLKLNGHVYPQVFPKLDVVKTSMNTPATKKKKLNVFIKPLQDKEKIWCANHPKLRRTDKADLYLCPWKMFKEQIYGNTAFCWNLNCEECLKGHSIGYADLVAYVKRNFPQEDLPSQ